MRQATIILYILTALFVLPFCAMAAECPAGSDDFTVNDGSWWYKGRPFYSTTAHAIYHTYRKDPAEGVAQLKEFKKAGFTIVECYWQWRDDMRPDRTWDFSTLDGFLEECKKLDLKTFLMFQEYKPPWLASELGWSHTSETGEDFFMIQDFYVYDPSFERECESFYKVLVEHLKENPDLSELVLYYNMGGEYSPYRPIRQKVHEKDYGYDKWTVGAFREWLDDKGYSPEDVQQRWGAAEGTYNTWDDVWPAVNLQETDFKGNRLANIGAARWDWYIFRQKSATAHMQNAIKWVREAGDNRPFMHEYNTVIPGGGIPLFMDWSTVGAWGKDAAKDGIYISSGTFDREFDYNWLVRNLGICKGASDPPWQSNEQGGMTTPEWMRRHAWFMIAMGGTGIHYWEWQGDGWGLVNSDGSPKDGYAEAVRMNAQIAHMGDKFASAMPMPSRVGILLLNEESLFSPPHAHKQEVGHILSTLVAMGYAVETAIITEDVLLRDINTDFMDLAAIIVPGQESMRDEVREKLAEFTKDGGLVWITPKTATRDGLNTKLTYTPGEPLLTAAGITNPAVGSLKLTTDDVNTEGGLYGVSEKAYSESSARPVAKIGDTPSIWWNDYGKGIFVTQEAYTAYLPGDDIPLVRDPQALGYYIYANSGQLPKSLLGEAMDKTGISPLAEVYTVDRSSAYKSETIFTGLKRLHNKQDEYYLFIIEGNNESDDIEVRLNTDRLDISGTYAAYDPFTGEKTRIENGVLFTQIDKAEVKILHLAPLMRSYDDYYADMADQWKETAKGLPEVRKTDLIPPDMIGQSDPGDLDDISPEPYGDNWLLVDISRHVNRSLVDEGKMENARTFLGGIGAGDNDLAELPTGVQTLGDIPFKILDPKEHRYSCMITKTSARPWLGPLEFMSIPVRSKVEKIHWLYGASWAPGGLPLGYINYNYADGTKDQVNLICEQNIANWWGYASTIKDEKLRRVWSGNTPASKRNFTSVGLYTYPWTNPHPEKELESIDIISYKSGSAIIVVAITAEK